MDETCPLCTGGMGGGEGYLDAPDLDGYRAVPCHAPEVSEVRPPRARAPRAREVLQHHRGVRLEVLLLGRGVTD
jgi:hypothetical protein